MLSVSRAPLGAFFVVAAALAACSASQASSEGRLCTPGAYVYCRCQDRQEGTKLCREDGASFEACLPCETETNPVDPTVPPDPVVDGGALAKCGNGIPDPGEACDDGNTDDADGCDAKCALSGADPVATRSCPGLDVHVWGTTAVTYTGSTSASPNTGSTPTCPSSEGNYPTTGAAANDRVFRVTTHATGMLVVTTTDTNYDNYVYASDTCKAPPEDTPYLACSNKTSGAGGETLEVPVASGKSYTVFVDGAGLSDNSGSFRVAFRMR